MYQALLVKKVVLISIWTFLNKECCLINHSCLKKQHLHRLCYSYSQHDIQHFLVLFLLFLYFTATLKRLQGKLFLYQRQQESYFHPNRACFLSILSMPISYPYE